MKGGEAMAVYYLVPPFVPEMAFTMEEQYPERLEATFEVAKQALSTKPGWGLRDSQGQVIVEVSIIEEASCAITMKDWRCRTKARNQT